MKLLPILFVFAVGTLAGCAHSLGEGSVAAGATIDSEKVASVEAPAPRRHLGNLSRSGVYDN